MCDAGTGRGKQRAAAKLMVMRMKVVPGWAVMLSADRSLEGTWDGRRGVGSISADPHWEGDSNNMKCRYEAGCDDDYRRELCAMEASPGVAMSERVGWPGPWPSPLVKDRPIVLPSKLSSILWSFPQNH